MPHTRRMSLEDQLKSNLGQKKAFGSSRHDGKANGTAGDKIYSYGTMNNYVKTGVQFAKWANEKFGETKVSKMDVYVRDYIQQMRDDGKSAYTQKSALSGLRKLFGSENECLKDIRTDARHRTDITRSRLDTEYARHFSESKNSELVNFCRKTGLRRSEVENLKGDRVIYKGDQAYIQGVEGKGGRVRDVRILGNDQAVIDRIQNTAADDLVWGRVHHAANIHGYRADYAQELYKSIAREEIPRDEQYHGRADCAGKTYDRLALKEVAENLGHSRVNVCVQNYLYDLD